MLRKGFEYFVVGVGFFYFGICFGNKVSFSYSGFFRLRCKMW